MKSSLNIYSVDTLEGDHIEYVVASDPNFGNYGENVMIADIDECCLSKKVIKQIIEEELDEEDERIKKKLKRRYGVYGW